MQHTVEKMVMRVFGWALRTLSHFPGRWRVLRWTQQHESVLQSWGPIAIVATRWGYRIRVDVRDYDGMKVLKQNLLGLPDIVGETIAECVNTGDCVLDIGANIGAYTLLAAKRVGREGIVYAFEALPQVAELLKDNVGINGFDNVTIYNVAVTDECGEALMSVVQGHLGMSSVRDLGDSAAERVAVKSLSVDSLLKELPRVSFVKIDVEGAEIMVLHGMSNLLNRDKPKILVEVTDVFLRNLGSSARDVVEYLTSMNYGLFIRRGGKWSRLSSVPTEQCDVLCVHELAGGTLGEGT